MRANSPYPRGCKPRHSLTCAGGRSALAKRPECRHDHGAAAKGVASRAACTLAGVAADSTGLVKAVAGGRRGQLGLICG